MGARLNQPSRVNYEGKMIGGQKSVFHWVVEVDRKLFYTGLQFSR